MSDIDTLILISSRRSLNQIGEETGENELQEHLRWAGASFQRGFPIMEGRRHVMRAIDA